MYTQSKGYKHVITFINMLKVGERRLDQESLDWNLKYKLNYYCIKLCLFNLQVN